MAKIQTLISDEWGEIAQFEIEGKSDIEAGIVHRFNSSSSRPHAVVVTADNRNQIRQVVVNGRDARRIETNANVIFVAQINPRKHNGFVEVNVALNDEVSSATVHAGFFRKFKERTKGMVRWAITKFADKCFVCRALVRMGIALVTGGVDLVGDALERALEAASTALDEIIDETLLGEILEMLGNAVNPGGLVAREVCRGLGYCK